MRYTTGGYAWRSRLLFWMWWALTGGTVVATVIAAIAHAEAEVYQLILIMPIGAVVAGACDRTILRGYPSAAERRRIKDGNRSVPVVGPSPYDTERRAATNGHARPDVIRYPGPERFRPGPADAIDPDVPPPITRAPWTKEQVDAVNRYQEREDVEHLLCEDHFGGKVRLIATTDYLFCPRLRCKTRQDWVYDAMLEDPA